MRTLRPPQRMRTQGILVRRHSSYHCWSEPCGRHARHEYGNSSPRGHHCIIAGGDPVDATNDKSAWNYCREALTSPLLVRTLRPPRSTRWQGIIAGRLSSHIAGENSVAATKDKMAGSSCQETLISPLLMRILQLPRRTIRQRIITGRLSSQYYR